MTFRKRKEKTGHPPKSHTDLQDVLKKARFEPRCVVRFSKPLLNLLVATEQ